MAGTTLHALVAAIAGAVGTAQDLVERNYLAMIRRYFDDDGRPLVMNVKLPSLSSDSSLPERQVAVPVLSLVDSRALGIKSVDISMDVALEGLIEPPAPSEPGAQAAAAFASSGAPLDYLNVGPQMPDALQAVIASAALPTQRSAMSVRLPQAGPPGPTARFTLRVEERQTSEALARLIAKLDTLI